MSCPFSLIAAKINIWWINPAVGTLVATNECMIGSEKIVIIDEAGFSHVCSSILSEKGYMSESLVRGDAALLQGRLDDASLLITSYPYGKSILEKLKGLALPIIVLADHVGREIIDVLEGLDNSYCMVKPIDYGRFTLLVQKLVNKDALNQGGYNIV